MVPTDDFLCLMHGISGSICVDCIFTVRDPAMTKSDLEFFDVSHIDWIPVEGNPGQHQRILAGDPDSGVVTRMLRFDPGTDTTRSGVLRHDFWEEVYIVSGELHDLTLDRVFGAGSYACRPPGMPHGPWVSDPGCITFEVRYTRGS